MCFKIFKSKMLRNEYVYIVLSLKTTINRNSSRVDACIKVCEHIILFNWCAISVYFTKGNYTKLFFTYFLPEL